MGAGSSSSDDMKRANEATVPSAQLAGTDSPKDLREFLVETNDLVNGAKPFTVVEEAKRAARVDKIVTNCLIIPAAEGGYARDGIQCLKGCESQMSKWRGENDFTDDEGRKRKKIMNFNYYRARVSASAHARRILFLLSTIAGQKGMIPEFYRILLLLLVL